MRPYLIALACFYTVLAIVTAVPVPASDQELDVLQIPLSNGKELDVLTLGAHDQEQIIAERNKRTIGLLRELFPDLTKIVNEEIDRYVNNLLKQVGPSILGTALNPSLNAPRRPISDDDDIFNDVVTSGSTTPPNLTVFEPDEEFESQRINRRRSFNGRTN